MTTDYTALIERLVRQVQWYAQIPNDGYKEGLRLAKEELASALRDLQAKLAEAERDARRYDFLRRESLRVDPVLGVTCKVHFDRNSSAWCNIADLDRTVDAALDTREK